MRWSVVFVFASAVFAQPSVNPRPFRIDELRTPAGFEVSIYARVPGGPRLMAFGPDGVLYVAARDAGAVYGVSAQDQVVRVLSGLRGPHSLVFQDNTLYVAADDGIYRVDSMSAVKIADLPVGGQHNSRTIGIGSDGKLYATAGSTCNFCLESDPRRAATMRFNLDGSGQEIFSRGQRNSVGIAWHPLTGDLWATDNGGDGLGDDIPPDEINILQPGGDYGWPDCYGDWQPLNWGSEARMERCSNTMAPEFKLQAHSAPLGISFYTGRQFPASYVNDAFVAFHGSWNRFEPTGYKVVRIHAASGHATGIEDFLWGFLDRKGRTTSGRPVDPVPGPDGALYVSDDDTGNIYRVSYSGPRINPAGIVRRESGVYELYGERLVNDPARLSVMANAQAVTVLFAGANQVNFQIPDGVTAPFTVVVQNEKASDSALVSE